MQSQCQRPGGPQNDRGPVQRQLEPVYDLATPPHGHQYSYIELLRYQAEATQSLHAMSTNCDEYRREAGRIAEELNQVKKESLRIATDVDQYKKSKQLLEKKVSESERVADIAISQHQNSIEQLDQVRAELKAAKGELNELQRQADAFQNQSLECRNDHTHLRVAAQNAELQLTIKETAIVDLHQKNVELNDMYTQAVERLSALEAEYSALVPLLKESRVQLARRGLAAPYNSDGNFFQCAMLCARPVDSHLHFGASNVLVGAECSSSRNLSDSFNLVGSSMTASVGGFGPSTGQVQDAVMSHTESLLADIARRYKGS